jgi:membrane protease YdiL (CAAX protease family)
MRSLAQTHPLATFLAIVYTVSAAIFALPLLSNSGIGVIDLDLPGVAPFILLDAVMLAVAAFVATALAEGRTGVREFRRRVFHFRVHPKWFVTAVLVLPVAALGAAVAAGGADVLASILADPATIGLTIIVGALFAFLLVNWWEETAWTGFALERLQPRLGPVAASVVTTWLQALVHVPLVFVAGGVTDGRVAADLIPFYLVALFILPIPVRITLTWLYNSADRSVPIVGLYHAGLGIATGTALIPVVAPGVNPLWVYAGFAAVAAAILVATRGRLGFGEARGATNASEQVALAS